MAVGVLATCWERGRACLGRWGHLVSPPHKGDIKTVLGVFSLVVEGEACIGGDDRNLAHVAQHLGPVVLPVPKNGYTQLGSMPLQWVAFFLVDVHMRLVPARRGSKLIRQRFGEVLLCCALGSSSNMPLA